MRGPGVLPFCLAYVGGTTGSYGLNLWLPKMVQKFGHLSIVETSLPSAIPAMVAIPAMLILGRNSDRTRERRLHASTPQLLAGFAMAGVVLASNNVLVALTLLSVVTAGILGAYGPCMSPKFHSALHSSRLCPGIAMVETSQTRMGVSRSPGFLIDGGLPCGVSLPNPS